MTKNDIVISVMESDLINSAILNICPPKYREDFRSHFYLQLLEMKEVKLQQAWNNGWLDWLCVKILSNQMNSNTSSFWKIYRNGGFAGEKKIWSQTELNEFRENHRDEVSPISYDGYFTLKDEGEEHIEKLELIELRRDLIIDTLNSRHFYHRHLFLLHLDGMTYRQIEKDTGISYQSVRLSIIATTEWLKKNIKK